MDEVRKKRPRLALMVSVAGIVALAAFGIFLFRQKLQAVTLRGTVIRADADPQKQSPIEGVAIIASDGRVITSSKTDFSGFFRLALPAQFQTGQSIFLEFRNPDYWPLDVKEIIANKLYVIRMEPVHPEVVIPPRLSQMPVANILVRYSIQTEEDANVGTAVKTFEVPNTGNLPCKRGSPCSPNGEWKASVVSTSLDVGEGNVFKNTRVSCIAGPCPFTQIDSEHISNDGHTFSVSVRNWSETVTYLVESEVAHPQIADNIRETYPVILGRSLNFTLPAAAQGVCLEAEVGGESIIFPLGPKPILDWATCETRTETNQTRSYRCELKPNFKFR